LDGSESFGPHSLVAYATGWGYSANEYTDGWGMWAVKQLLIGVVY